MSSELYYFPNIEKGPNPSTLSIELHSEFEKNLENNRHGNETIIKNRKNNRQNQSEIAYSEGLKEGERIGREKEKNRVNEAVELLRNTVESLNKSKTESTDKMKEITSKLSIMIAKKIIDKEACIGSDLICTTIKKAIEGFELEEHLRIFINPVDLKHVELFQSKKCLGNNVEIKTDSAISKGGCIVESEYKTLDARIESQLEIIENALEELRLNQSTSLSINES